MPHTKPGTLTATQAVEIIRTQYGEDIARQSLEAWLRSGRCPFGEYIRNPGSQRGHYLIFRSRMEFYFKPQHDIGRALVDRVYFRAEGGEIA